MFFQSTIANELGRRHSPKSLQMRGNPFHFAIVILLVVAVLAGRSSYRDLENHTLPATTINSVAPPFQRARRRRRRGTSAEQSTESEGIAASYARYSSDSQREESIADQQRTCHELAEQNRHRILPEFEYGDEAVSGTKRRRAGLDAMLRDAEAGEFQVLYFHSLSRLSRESVITMPMLKRLVYTYKVRIISVTEGIDSARDNWEVIASIMSLMHERYIKELAENVFRGQEGAVLAGLCVGDYRFGYSSEPIPGSEKTRKGRNPKPRMAYVPDDKTWPWVVRIFHWFVKERRSLRWIARELNKRGAPKDHRSSTPHWHHKQVAELLASLKYLGIWPWGEMKNTRDPETGKIRQEERPEEECEKWTRHFPNLQIIDDETFAKAQELLEENYEKYAANRRSDGTLHWKKRGSADCPPRHLLSGLIKCAACGATFHVGGANGKYMFCPGYHKGVCTCQTQLRRDRAERMILEELGKRILADPQWFQAVFDHTLKSWKQREERGPAELVSTERALADVERKISRLVDRIENGYDDPDVKSRLEERRDTRRELVKRIEQLKRENENHGPEPTEQWVRQQLQQLGDSLKCDNPAAANALRDLVGGEIVVTEIRREGRKRFHLQGRFTIVSNSLANVATSSATESHCEGAVCDDLSENIVIDFVDPNPLDANSEKAKELYDQELMNAQIAKQLGCSRSQVTKLLKHWFESRGLEMPDGRTRRSELAQQHMEPPLYQKIADDVKRLSDDRLLLQEIAEELNVDRNTVTKAWAYWHESRSLDVPDGRSRRKNLERKVSRSRRQSGGSDAQTV